MPAKLDRCVDDIKAKGQADGVNPWAVCKASIGEIKPEDTEKLLNELDDITSADATFPSADASYKHTGPMVTTKKPETYGNTAQIEETHEPWYIPDGVKPTASLEETLTEIDDMLSKSATFPTSNSSFKHKTGGLVTRLKPDTFGNTGNETVSIPGSLSAVKIKGKKKESHSMQETIYKSVFDYKLSHPCKCKNKK